MLRANPAKIKAGRILKLLGVALALMGVSTLLILNAFFGYQSIWVWAAGGIMLIVGILMAKSQTIAHFLRDII